MTSVSASTPGPVVRTRRRADRLNRFALVASAAFLLHCLALPLVLTALPVLMPLTGGPRWFHVAVLSLAAPASALALGPGWRRRRLPALLGCVGSLALATGAASGEGARETVATVAGSLLLAFAHVANWRARHA